MYNTVTTYYLYILLIIQTSVIFIYTLLLPLPLPSKHNTIYPTTPTPYLTDYSATSPSPRAYPTPLSQQRPTAPSQ